MAKLLCNSAKYGTIIKKVKIFLYIININEYFYLLQQKHIFFVLIFEKGREKSLFFIKYNLGEYCL